MNKVDQAWETLMQRRAMHARRVSEVSAAELEIEEARSAVEEARSAAAAAEAVVRDKIKARDEALQRQRAAASAVSDGVAALQSLLPSVVAGLGRPEPVKHTTVTEAAE